MYTSWPLVLPVMEEMARLGACHDLSSGTISGMEKSNIFTRQSFFLVIAKAGLSRLF
jgi:hypothetical protein